MTNSQIVGTALVTGASSGIGRSFAEILANGSSPLGKYNLVIVARDKKRLADVKKTLESTYDISCEVMSKDLETDDGINDTIERLRSKDSRIDVVINNAGYGVQGNFATLPIESSMGQIELNVKALVRITHAAVQDMSNRGGGKILNVSSIAGFLPAPSSNVYAATKAFVTRFSEGLKVELKGTNISLTCLCPGFTKTEFQERADVNSDAIPPFMWQSPDVVAMEGLIGLSKNQSLVIPGIHNKAVVAVSQVLPSSVLRAIAGVVSKRI